MGTRHVPLRSCVICGNKTSKRDLVRMVTTPDGGVMLDATGRMAGRGAYVCRDGDCRRGGLDRRRLEYALRTKLNAEEWAKTASSMGDSVTSR